MSNSQEFSKLIDLDLRRKGMVLGTAIALEMAIQALKEATGKDVRDTLVAFAIDKARTMSIEQINEEISKIDTALSNPRQTPFHRWTLN